MKPILLFITVMFFHLVCEAQQTINGTIHHDGLTREYILDIPKSYDSDKETPLLFCFHGFTSSASTLRNYSRMHQIGESEGFITIYPQGTLFNGQTHWNVGGFTTGSTTDDVGFIETLLDSMSRAYNIDSSRVYSTGMSNGGYMSFLLACQLSDKFAAIASVTGSMSPQTYDDCDPQHPTPILQIHGTADGTVPYSGAFWSKSIQDVMDYWIDYNNCDENAVVTAIPDTDPTDGSTVEHFVYNDGDNRVTTEHFKITGGDHTWPGVWGNNDINASIEVWKFFARYDIHGLRMTTDADNLTFLNTSINIYPNPTSNEIHIDGDQLRSNQYEIFSLDNKLLLSGTLAQKDNTIDVSQLRTGIYLIRIADQTAKLIKTE